MRSYLLNISALFILSFFISATAFAQDGREAQQTASPVMAEQTVKLKVTGINCSGDLKDIEKQISSLNGVSYCKPARKPAATTLFEVKFNPALVSEKEIRKAVEATAGCSDSESRPYKVKA